MHKRIVVSVIYDIKIVLVLKDKLCRLCSVFEGRCEILHIILGKLAQHPVCKIIVRIRLRTNAYSYSWEFIRAEKCNDALHAVMTACAALSSYAQLTRRKRYVIIHYNNSFGRNFVESCRLRNCFAA